MSGGLRAVRLLLLGINILLGVALAAGGLLATDAAWQVRLVLALYGVCWLATLPIVVRAWWGVTARTGRVHTGADATVVDYDPGPVRGGVFVTGWLTGVTLLASVLALAAGAVAGGVLGLALTAFFAALLIDLVAALRRGARLTLTPQRIDVRGWRSEASLDWSDVAEVEVVRVDRRPHLLVRAATDPDSWQGRRLGPSWLSRPRLEPGTLLIESAAVEPHTPLLFDALRRWSRDASTRSELGTIEAERQLRGPLA